MINAASSQIVISIIGSRLLYLRKYRKAGSEGALDGNWTSLLSWLVSFLSEVSSSRQAMRASSVEADVTLNGALPSVLGAVTGSLLSPVLLGDGILTTTSNATVTNHGTVIGASILTPLTGTDVRRRAADARWNADKRWRDQGRCRRCARPNGGVDHQQRGQYRGHRRDGCRRIAERRGKASATRPRLRRFPGPWTVSTRPRPRP